MSCGQGLRYSSPSGVDSIHFTEETILRRSDTGSCGGHLTLRGKKESDSGLSATGMAVPSCIISGLDCVSITIAENGVNDTSHCWLVKIKGVPSSQGREGGTWPKRQGNNKTEGNGASMSWKIQDADRW